MLNRVSSDRIRLGPPADDDLDWILGELRDPETARTLGWMNGIGSEIYTGYVEGTALLLPFWNRAHERIGFFMLRRPDLRVRTWSVFVVVPKPSHRNAFSALAACDALCYMVFDVQHDDGLIWRIEPENGASLALPKRLGYPKHTDIAVEGTLYCEFCIGPADWVARKERLGQRVPKFRATSVPLAEVAHGRILEVIRATTPTW